MTTNGKYEFTDGCGRMSTKVARAFVENMTKYNPNVVQRYAHQPFKVPSVIQFRMMGCKGILVHDPTLDDPDKNPDGIQVYLRDSQNKFPWNTKTIKKGNQLLLDYHP